jgi:hypothetical protein
LLKKTITYKDFNDEEVSEDFYFHLSRAELVELEMSHRGGLSVSLERIIASEDNKSIIAEFKNIILSSYGKRSDDGRQFIKNQELRDEFASTEAYSALFMELVTDANAATEFINGIMPAGLVEETQQALEQRGELKEVKPKLSDKELAQLYQKPVSELDPDVYDQLQDYRRRLAAGEVSLAE